MSTTLIDQVRRLVLVVIVMPALSFAQEDHTVETPPRSVSQPDLQFPNAALMGRVTGTVWLKLLIGADGIPLKTEIVKRDPEMAFLFDDNARKWGMACRFTPALDSGGKSVPAWEVIPLSFRLDHFTPPQCLSQAKPEYPEDARVMGMEGWVGLAVLIKSNGEVDKSQILVVARSPENTSIFERAAKDAAYHSQYRAAGYNANSVEGWCFIKVPFLLAGGSGQRISSGE